MNEILVMMCIVDYVLLYLNIIYLLDVYEDDDVVYLVLELCRGGEFFDCIVEQEWYFERDVVIVVGQIVVGFVVLYYCGIVY